MKKRNVVTGAVVLGVVAGAFLSGLFPGFGLGSGNGNGDGEGTGNVSVDASGSQPTTEQSETADADSGRQADDDTKPAPRLDVRIDDSSLLVRNGNGAGYREVELPELVDLAKKTGGDDNGIRVLIQRRKNARLVTWSSLIQELKNAGLSADSISMPKELVD